MDETTDGDDTQGHPRAETVGVRDSIGDAEIDAAIQALNGLDDRPVQEHADALERAHHVLQERLAEGQE